jgi:sec-independent protein translocase protein TatA
MPFNLGGPELMVILVIVLIVFGAGKLPNVMRDLGKGVKEFKKAQSDEETEATSLSGASSAAPVAPSTTPAPPAPVASSNGAAPAASRGTETSSRA